MMNKKFATALLVGLVGFGMTTASADVTKGQKLYQKKYKKKCGMSGAKMAGSNDQMTWEEMKDDGTLKEYLEGKCGPVQESHLEHLYDFFYEYASDSGNVPSC